MKLEKISSLLGIAHSSKVLSTFDEAQLFRILKDSFGEPYVNRFSFSWRLNDLTVYLRDLSAHDGRRQLRIKSRVPGLGRPGATMIETLKSFAKNPSEFRIMKMFCAKETHPEAVKRIFETNDVPLLKKIITNNLVDYEAFGLHKTEMLDSLLYEAVSYGNPKVVEYLLSAGANIRGIDDAGLLEMATDSPEILRLLESSLAKI